MLGEKMHNSQQMPNKYKNRCVAVFFYVVFLRHCAYFSGMAEQFNCISVVFSLFRPHMPLFILLYQYKIEFTGNLKKHIIFVLTSLGDMLKLFLIGLNPTERWFNKFFCKGA